MNLWEFKAVEETFSGTSRFNPVVQYSKGAPGLDDSYCTFCDICSGIDLEKSLSLAIETLCMCMKLKKTGHSTILHTHEQWNGQYLTEMFILRDSTGFHSIPLRESNVSKKKRSSRFLLLVLFICVANGHILQKASFKCRADTNCIYCRWKGAFSSDIIGSVTKMYGNYRPTYSIGASLKYYTMGFPYTF